MPRKAPGVVGVQFPLMSGGTVIIKARNEKEAARLLKMTMKELRDARKTVGASGKGV